MKTASYTEKRRSSRAICGKRVKVFEKRLERPFYIRDISRHGALLKTRTSLYKDDILDLAVNLPTEKKPLDLSARVIRTVTVCTAWGFRNFEIGVEFLDLVETQKEKLQRAADYLVDKTQDNLA